MSTLISANSDSDSDDDGSANPRLRHHGGHPRYFGWQRKVLGLGGGVLVGSETGVMRGPKVLAADASDTDDFYVGWKITTTNPDGTGLIRKYNGATKAVIATMDCQGNQTTGASTTYTITNQVPARAQARSAPESDNVGHACP